MANVRDDGLFKHLNAVDLLLAPRLGFRELEGAMIRERALRIVLVLLGLIFVAGIYPLITSVRDGWQTNKEDPLPMGLSLYVMIGDFFCSSLRGIRRRIALGRRSSTALEEGAFHSRTEQGPQP